jgi:hypothetical protein
MGKKFELDSIISRLKEGKKAKEIAKELNISNSNLSYYLGKLKKDSLIKYKGNGIWLVQKLPPTPSTQKKIRGHAFVWKIELKEINWKKYLDNSKINYKEQSNGKVLRIFFLGKKVWLTKKGMVIYEPYNYWGSNSYEAKGKAVFNLDRFIKNLLFKLKIRELPYKFTTSREHFAIVKNELARQYNDKGEKMYIENEGGVWMWIDFSHGINELENNNVDTNKMVQDFWNDNLKHKFQVTPSFILNAINKVTQNQQMFAQNFESHVEAIKTLSEKVKELSEVIKELKK